MEIQAVNGACEPEIASAWDALAEVLDNQFLETAGVSGVSLWEKELGILPKDTDSLAGRKARVKAMWNRETPYTFTWLERWLDGICGPEGHRETLEDYTLHIRLDHTARPDTGDLPLEILNMLAEVRPANIRLLLENILSLQGVLNSGVTGTAAITQPVPALPDRMKWLDTLRAGGGAGAVFVLPVPEGL